MSQWKQIQQLEMRLLEQVDYLYDDNFPMDIRQGLAGWIEAQDWESAVNDESMASVMFTNLQTQLEKVRSQEQNFLQRHNMKIIQQQLQNKTKTQTQNKNKTQNNIDTKTQNKNKTQTQNNSKTQSNFDTKTQNKTKTQTNTDTKTQAQNKSKTQTNNRNNT
ncbi:PREDICTED: signal transducer and activator of transcription 4-like [Cyprinodon variegatus]|uniref:signal transducer and activator of transcription 4-like n=1 Tax=Cyprinodon variegatus TaxID=28743 RepID=UPI000742ACD8|nr:PREDICTED: signal transducer and activator of transcription 4-like [Cyprinodon variegatus]